MNIETWLAFTAASTVLIVIPGPTILLVVSYAAMTVSLLGLGALLATSATVFTILKWAGAAYLVWLGIKLWRSGGTLDAKPRMDAASSLRMLCHAWLVTALNPKGLTFFIAFLPQFIDPQLPLAPQVGVFGATFLVLAFANAVTYALIASRARTVVLSPQAMGLFNKAGGSLLIGAGIATVAVRAGQS